ncbi:lysophospholipid acyltransferase family protein [Granulicella sibirica]|uniref:1-acyl-sn-glycerol-3-phosphate acyltransferase n=1 Tax=Granulicella sibirica TaxID=2479048 RepID=A0A4Q0T0M5_9BACT|nr:lysophospholipid acyltransferase family protein [Granulicella sibirica]RXH57143.1 1-acyl-sn-glycerol-3-phosphate acyltransferase [Granulicella sibirica]
MSEQIASRLVRSITRTTLLVFLLTLACIDGQIRRLFFGLRKGRAGAVWVHGWSKRIVRALGIACTVCGPLPECEAGRSMAVVSNHLSYLDILISSAARPFVMVAKSEVRGWPLLGWITAQAGTVYVQRADVKGGRTQTHAEVNGLMAEAFGSGLPVLFYPEGTTTDGESVLPFRRGLFHSVLFANAQVRSAAVAYKLSEPNAGASVANDVCFWRDMEFVPHLFTCLGLKGLEGHLQFGDRAVEGGDRFALAVNARAEVTALYEGLCSASVEMLPEGVLTPHSPRVSRMTATT